MPIRAAIYTRVSTIGNGQSLEMQLRELREYVERRGWTLSDEYVDEGISGTKDSRPELNRLMADAHRRKCDVVAVWKFDRMTRSVGHLLWYSIRSESWALNLFPCLKASTQRRLRGV